MLHSAKPSPQKPLYLASGRGWTVAVDGLALRICAPRQAVRYAPLRRISRVLSATDAQWETPALLACLEAGIPIVFTDGHGRAKGYCHGMRRRETSLASLLVEAVEQSDWTERYSNWLHAMHCQMVRKALAAAGLRIGFRDFAAARSKLCAACNRRCRRVVTGLLHQLDGFMHALVVERLHQTVAAARFMGHPRPGLCLVSDFTALMSWSSFGLVQQWAKNNLEEEQEQRIAAQLLEQERQQLAAHLSSLTDNFELWLRDWIQEGEI